MNGPRRFVISVDGRRLDVAVQASPAGGSVGGAVEVTVDGHTHWVTETAGGDQLVRRDDSGPQVRVALPDDPQPQWAASRGQIHTLVVRTARQAAHDEAEAAAAGGATGTATIQAPMPGRVVKVLVDDGQRVEAGDALLIVEAMKMENEVRAPVGGRVARLSVAAGATVEPGQVLLTLEPEPESEPG